MDARRDAILRVLGVERYVPRDGTPFAASLVGAAPEAARAVPPTSPPVPETAAAPSTLVTDDPFDAPPRRPATRAKAPDAAPPVAFEDVSSFDWPTLELTVAACTRCGLEATRTQTVFGVGNRSAEWMVVGEAPGAEEDRQGEPFVGRAGQLLNQMLRALGFAREQVMIANVLKCRPPGNRDPQPREVQCCIPYLHRQIALVNPKIVLCVGRIAAQNLLATDSTLAKLRGRVHRLEATGTPVVVTYHPAYLLRSPGEKRKAWADLLYAREVASGHGA